MREWREGARIALSGRTLRTLLVFTLITGVGEAIMVTLMAPFVRDVLHGGPEAYGTIMAVQAVGGLAGGTVTTLVGRRIPPRLLLGGGAVAFGLLDLALFLYPLSLSALWPALLIMILVGLPGAMMSAGLVTIFQAATEDGHRGRVFGAITALHSAAMLAGIGIAGSAGCPAGSASSTSPTPATCGAGILPIIAIQGIAHCVAGLFVLAALPRPRIERDDDREWVRTPAVPSTTVES